MRVWVWLVLLALAAGCIFEDPITQEAMQKGDPEICKDLEEQAEINDCITKVAGKAGKDSICDEYFKDDKKLREECYGEVGGSTADHNICARITDDYTRDRCYDSVHFQTTDPGLCEKIKDEHIQATCLTRSANVRKDYKYCEEISEELVSIRDDCYRSAGTNSRNPEACRSIMDKAKRDFCFAVTQNDPDECAKLGSQYAIKECLNYVAMQGNEKACEKSGEQDRDDCVQLLAGALNDTDRCKTINDAFTRDFCVKDIAKRTMSVTECDKIKDEKKREECVSEVGDAIKRYHKETGQQSLVEKIEDKVTNTVGDILLGQLK